MKISSSRGVVAVASALAGCLGLPVSEQSAGSVDAAPWDAAVGAIEIHGVLRCSAVLVDEWHVATAAYCLPAAHLDNPEILGRSEMFFVTGPAVDAPDARRIPIVAHEVLGQGIPEPLSPDLGIGRLAEPVMGPALPLAPAGSLWTEWSTRMRVVTMGAPTVTAPFGARRAMDLEVAATSAELIDLYKTDGTFCLSDMGGAVIAEVDGQAVLAGVLGHWATRGGEPASNGDWCSSPADGQAFATRTEQGSFVTAAAARLDARTGFASAIVGPGPSGAWLLYESFPLQDNTSHGTGVDLPAGATSLVVDLVSLPGDPLPQLAVAKGRMPRIGQAPQCESLGQACQQGSPDACAQFDRECGAPVFVDADCLPIAAERQTCTIALDGSADYAGVSVSNLDGDRPSTYAVAAWTTSVPAEAQ